MAKYDVVAGCFRGSIGSKDFVPRAFDPNDAVSMSRAVSAVKLLAEQNAAGNHRNVSDTKFMSAKTF
jgi:hypothetical protein